MADDEVTIKLVIDDSNLDEVKGKINKEKTDESIIPDIETKAGKVTSGGGDNILDEAKYHALFATAGGIGSQGLSKGLAGAKNPMGMLSGLFTGAGLAKFMPKMLAKAIPIVGWAVMAVEIIPLITKAIIDQLTKAGSPFDKRFKRAISKERNAFFSREEQRKRQLGLSPVIMTSVQGFNNLGGMATTYTLKQIKEAGVSSIGLRDKAGGFTY